MKLRLPQPGFRDWMILGSVAVAFLVAWLLYPSRGDRAEETGRRTIVLWLPPQPDFMEPYTAAAREFERLHPQYSVQVGSAITRDVAGDPTRFLLGVAGGEPPDVILFDRFAIVEWAGLGAFTDLWRYVRQDQAEGHPDAIREEDFYAVAWREPVYQGGLFAIPTDTDTRALYYHDAALQRAGLVHSSTDPEVLAGRAALETPRPPRTWEELCRKLGHYRGRVSADGEIDLVGFHRDRGVNEGVPDDVVPDLAAAGVRAGDVVILVSGSAVFRGRVAAVSGARRLRIDLRREQPPNRDSVPSGFTGAVQVKIISQDSYVSRLTRFDPDSGRMTQAAMLPLFGNSHLYLFGWLNGAEFLSEDGRTVLLNSPEVVETVQWLSDCYDAMGGYREANLLWSSSAAAGLDPFISGRIAMVIHVNTFVGNILTTNPELEFGVAPSPQPERRWMQGFMPVGWGGGFAFGIPAAAKNQDDAWKLIRFLCSRAGMEQHIAARRRLAAARGVPFFPPLSARTDITSYVRDRYVLESPELRERHRRAFDVFMGLLPTNRHRPVTPVGQKLWMEQFRSAEAALGHMDAPAVALNRGARNAQQALDRVLAPVVGPEIPWRPAIALYLAAFVAFFVTVVVRGRDRPTGNPVQSGWVRGYVCAAPWLVGFLVFGAGPILFTILISFSHYDVLSSARWMGVDNYVQLLGWHRDAELERWVPNDPLLWKSLGNTLFMALGVPLGIALGLAIALLLNAKVKGLSVFRTLFYLPAIVPAVATFVLWLWLFEPMSGGINIALEALGLVESPPRWLRDPAWSKPSLMIMGLWGVGGGMIIWLAGLKDIPVSLYEAAEIDGANRWQQFVHVTIPMLSPYILFNVIMGFIHVFQIFESAYIMTQGGPADSTLFFAYKLFNEAFRFLDMGRASAMAWILFLIVMSITLLQLGLSRRWVHYRG